MSFRSWVAVVQVCSVLVIPSKDKIGQRHHTPHQQKKKKKRGSGETHAGTHKSLNFHKEISRYILQCFLGNHFSAKGTLCLLLFAKLFEPPYLIKGCFTGNLCSIKKSSICSLLHHQRQYLYQQPEYFRFYLLRIGKIMSSFLKVREIKSSCFLCFSSSDMECLSLCSTAVLEKKRQKSFWEALISTVLLACWLRRRYILFFFPLTTEAAGTGFPQAGLSVPVWALSWLCPHAGPCHPPAQTPWAGTKDPKPSGSEGRTCVPGVTQALRPCRLSPPVVRDAPPKMGQFLSSFTPEGAANPVVDCRQKESPP